ncbi:MAG: hypothetical protein HQ510_08995 [Candidatus Marinimicrobia bacterium]|nr:hypothetical protein [Candidatus Neomarinimicrobiota bacterium]
MKIKPSLIVLLFIVTAGFTQNSQTQLDEEAMIELIYQPMFNKFVQQTETFRRMSREQIIFENLYASAPAASIQAHADFADTLMMMSPTASIYFSGDNQQNWSASECIHLGTPGYLNTWECDFSYSGSGQLDWYLRVAHDYELERAVVSQCPENALDIFPPPANTLASLADEPAGDLAIGDSLFLDLTGMNVTYSSDRLFVELTTTSGGFPVGEFFGPWYLYGAGFLNPIQDLNSDQLSIYALGYGNGFFGNLHPGVMKLVGTPGGEIISAEYISTDIEYLVSGNSLFLSVAKNIITDDPDFGAWPGDINGFVVMGLTASADINQNMMFHDGTAPGLILMDHQTQSGNSAPTLSDVGYNSETFTLTATYSDPDANLPFFHQITHQGNIWEMIPASHQYENPVEYSFTIPEPTDGAYNVVFSFSDGAVTDQESFSFTIGEATVCLITGDTNDDGAVNVLDVVILVAEILCGNCTDSTPCFDVNLDGNVNVLDVVLLVDMILNG